MFILTGKVSFTDFYGNTLSGSFSSCKWKNSIDNYCQSAEIVLPSQTRLPPYPYQDVNYKNEDGTISTSLVIKKGMKVRISCGYDQNNKERFRGYVVSTTSNKSRLAIICEGYSYLLREKILNAKSFYNSYLKDILNYIIDGTEIKLSKDIQNIQLGGNVIISPNQRAIDVLDYLKDKCLLTVWFKDDELYAGLRFIQKGNIVRARINWNVIDADSLLYNEYNPYKVELAPPKKKDGSKTIVTSGNGTMLRVKVRHFTDEEFIKQLALDINKQKNLGQYSGSLKMFLEPYVRPTDSIVIEDQQFPERNGTYFVDEVEGSFSNSGGRQTVKISLKLPS